LTPVTVLISVHCAETCSFNTKTVCVTGSLMSVEGHANLKLTCIKHTQNGDIKTYPSIRPWTMTSWTVARQGFPGDTSNWVFNFDCNPKIFCNTYAICLTTCLVKYTPTDNYAEWNGPWNWKFRLSIVPHFLEFCCRHWIPIYMKNCILNIQNSNKILQMWKPWIWNSWLFKEVKKGKASWWTTN
jgi:hypothetical protein